MDSQIASTQLLSIPWSP